MEKCAKINHYHVSLFSEFVEKLRQTPDGDGSLLDHVAIVYGAGMSEGNGHVPENLPILLVGGARRPDRGRPPREVREGHAAGELPPRACWIGLACRIEQHRQQHRSRSSLA